MNNRPERQNAGRVEWLSESFPSKYIPSEIDPLKLEFPKTVNFFEKRIP